MRACRRFAVLVAAVAVLGCKKAPPPAANTVDISNAVVRVDDTVIDVKVVEQHIARLPPPVRARYATLEGRKELADNLVRFELLANEAKRRGIDRRPQVQRMIKQQMINVLLEEQAAGVHPAADAGPKEPTDEAAEKYYRDNPALFQRGEQVRIAHVRVQDRATAQKVAVAARRLRPTDSAAFAKLVAQYTDDAATKDRGGDLGFLDRNATEHSPTVVAAGFALAEPGATSDPVETDKGFHILRLTEKRPPAPAPFTDVKAEAKARVAQEERDYLLKQLIDGLRAKAKIEVYDRRLEQVLAH